jgi:hypothetical protein
MLISSVKRPATSKPTSATKTFNLIFDIGADQKRKISFMDVVLNMSIGKQTAIVFIPPCFVKQA